jgi:hypothetical protein
MKSYSQEEFVEYVKKLEFDELEDCAAFVTQYYNYYRDVPESDKEEKDAAWGKYMTLMAKYGMMFVAFAASVVEFRKMLQNEISEEESRSTGSLESGAN